MNNISAASGVSVEPIVFNGWTHALRIHNRACELIIVPELSRVMHFGLKSGENLIWVAPSAHGQTYAQAGNDWRNLGGDKIWPQPQEVWNWPPPYFFDNAPSDAEIIPGGVRLRTQKIGPRLGSVCVREFVLDPREPRVTVRQRLEKSSGPPVAMTLWNITQVCSPNYALLPLGPENAGKRFHDFKRGKLDAPQFQLHETVLSLRNHDGAAKVGVSPDAAGANGWVAAVFPHCLFLESRRVDRIAAYPDGNCHAELFTAPPELGPYVELELLSPLKSVNAGEALEDDSVWQIVPLSEKESRDPEQAAAAARAAHAIALEAIQQH